MADLAAGKGAGALSSGAAGGSTFGRPVPEPTGDAASVRGKDEEAEVVSRDGAGVREGGGPPGGDEDAAVPRWAEEIKPAWRGIRSLLFSMLEGLERNGQVPPDAADEWRSSFAEEIEATKKALRASRFKGLFSKAWDLIRDIEQYGGTVEAPNEDVVEAMRAGMVDLTVASLVFVQLNEHSLEAAKTFRRLATILSGTKTEDCALLAKEYKFPGGAVEDWPREFFSVEKRDMAWDVAAEQAWRCLTTATRLLEFPEHGKREEREHAPIVSLIVSALCGRLQDVGPGSSVVDRGRDAKGDGSKGPRYTFKLGPDKSWDPMSGSWMPERAPAGGAEEEKVGRLADLAVVKEARVGAVVGPRESHRHDLALCLPKDGPFESIMTTDIVVPVEVKPLSLSDSSKRETVAWKDHDATAVGQVLRSLMGARTQLLGPVDVDGYLYGLSVHVAGYRVVRWGSRASELGRGREADAGWSVFEEWSLPFKGKVKKASGDGAAGDEPPDGAAGGGPPDETLSPAPESFKRLFALFQYGLLPRHCFAREDVWVDDVVRHGSLLPTTATSASHDEEGADDSHRRLGLLRLGRLGMGSAAKVWTTCRISVGGEVEEVDTALVVKVGRSKGRTQVESDREETEGNESAGGDEGGEGADAEGKGGKSKRPLSWEDLVRHGGSGWCGPSAQFAKEKEVLLAMDGERRRLEGTGGPAGGEGAGSEPHSSILCGLMDHVPRLELSGTCGGNLVLGLSPVGVPLLDMVLCGLVGGKEHAEAVGFGLAAALHAAHSMGVFHTDLHIGNVVMAMDPSSNKEEVRMRAVVIDWGACAEKDEVVTRNRWYYHVGHEFETESCREREKVGPEMDLQCAARLVAAIAGCHGFKGREHMSRPLADPSSSLEGTIGAFCSGCKAERADPSVYEAFSLREGGGYLTLTGGAARVFMSAVVASSAIPSSATGKDPEPEGTLSPPVHPDTVPA